MGERIASGAGASPGLATGAARLLDAVVARDELPAGDHDAEAARAAAALESAAARLDELAEQGHGAEAEIIAAGALMARDPALAAAVEAEVRSNGSSAPAALLAAAEQMAAMLAAIDDPTLAARAEDVRSVGRRAARIAAGGGPDGSDGPDGATARAPVVVIAGDLGPADVAELGDDVCAIALAHGAVTAHAAIVARARGVPMVVGVGERALGARPGDAVVVDGDSGALVLEPSAERLGAAAAAMSARAGEAARAAARRDLPAVTRDGRVVRVLCNAASAAEVRIGLAAGAEGAGLIRTELAFLDAPAWPTEEEHLAALAPVLTALRGHVATVRVLDFGGDKTPPFLNGTDERGLALLLSEPAAFAAQVRAIVHAAAGCDLRLLLPMVQSAAELRAARELIPAGVAVGAMIETPAAAQAAPELAAGAEFLSIGTNDLTHATLGSDRFAAVDAPTHDPAVLHWIDASVRAAHAAGLPIEVCGEAASDPATLPLLVGLDVDEVSVGAARVGRVREWVRELDSGECRDRAARRALLFTR
jgi:phosphoenolpyruvate-protein kinase (PTS system EI component)